MKSLIFTCAALLALCTPTFAEEADPGDYPWSAETLTLPEGMVCIGEAVERLKRTQYEARLHRAATDTAGIADEFNEELGRNLIARTCYFLTPPDDVSTVRAEAESTSRS